MNRPTENRYRFAYPRELEPAGWLRVQLETEAKGLAGNLDKVWNDVKNSRWIGGTCEGWERVPYWLDGFIPLAFLLWDEDMISRAKVYIEAIFAGQCEDGWICPCTEEERPNYDMWALLLISKVLTVWADACPEDEDRVERALVRALKQAKEHLCAHPLFSWGQYRWFEGLIAVFWLYDRLHEDWLLDFADLLHAQGRDYVKLFTEDFDACKEIVYKWEWDRHVVNHGMALKSDCLWRKRLGVKNEDADANVEMMYETLQTCHGMPTGHFTGDECLAGRSPVQGSELCSVVEAMYSDEWNLAVTGKPVWGDRLERLAFNALPATISADMWTHQYDQQTNQIACAPETDRVVWTSNGREANVFGLEPNYGCCTANMPQGWPKFALSVFMKNEDAVLSAVCAPAIFTTEMHGVKVSVSCKTRYPFGDTAEYTVSADAPVDFSLDVRIPGYCVSAFLDGKQVTPGTISSVRRVWSGTQTVSLVFSFEAKLEPAGWHDLYVVNRGPLLFSLPIRAERVMTEYTRGGVERKFPYCDYLLYPKDEWGFGFASDRFEAALCEDDERLESAPAFDWETNPAPVTLKAELYPIDWGKKPDFAWVCADDPQSAVPTGEKRTVTLVPYGCTDLRMTAMPLLGTALPVVK